MRLRLVLFAMIFGLCAAPFATAGPLSAREGWTVHPTPFAYQALVDRLTAAIMAEKMGLVTQASASDGARGQGIEIPGNRVLGVYRNDFARRMLKASVAAGIEAPIRFYVTEDEAGSATLSYKTPSHVFAPYMEEGGAELKALAEDLDAIFEAIAQRAIAP
ncbi:DUF302 domain-containing protein [Breoghania sp. L-A4]|uniref:DUF302 domain-containing protein n=1 Tax=Breoghania sp. L-A4 TaxID=2304600 RepID=UPI000E35BA0E|nr:DUF302 domain-containing protein [Breoghania sp. L-A4]AXS39348.1 DUF302 domain-containing protein [Breoghania sp. L-A4]